MSKIAIIGAGPAGIYTTLFLRDFFGQIDLYEKNSTIGKKLSLTGGGRMNLSNRNFSVQNFYSQEKNILKNIFKKPYAQNILELFEELGTKYKWEADRAILASESAKKEIERLQKMLASQRNTKIHLGQTVSQIKTHNGKFLIGKEIYDYVVLSSGGQVCVGEDSADIYALARQLGHTLTEITPALCPLLCPKNIFVGLAGTALECRLMDPQRKQSTQGDLIFTHVGISGPAVLDFSLGYDTGAILLNFLPNLTEDDLKQKLAESRRGKIFLRSFLAHFLPKKIVLWQMQFAQIDADKLVTDLKKTELQNLLKNLYGFRLDGLRKPDFGSSWTSRGGVKLSEISYATLESKLHPNLFFAGEILDITGLCGGYNISFAMLSAKIISETILRKTS